MATIGVSKPYFARYNAAAGTVSYSGGGIFAKVTEFGATINAAEENPFYADNGIQENEVARFGDGALTVTTDDLTNDATIALLGAALRDVTVGEATLKEIVYDDDLSSPYLGFGIIIQKKRNNVLKYRAVVFPKVRFAVPAEAATTQGETIEWQTPTLEGTIFRDDSAKHRWKREATFATEAEARAYIQAVLNIALGTLTVASVAGAESGDTAITVTEDLGSGHVYLYKTGAELTAPALDAVLTEGYTLWDGVSDITATTGEDILIVEVDKDDYRALKAGIAEVVSNAGT